MIHVIVVRKLDGWVLQCPYCISNVGLAPQDPCGTVKWDWLYRAGQTIEVDLQVAADRSFWNFVGGHNALS